MHLAVYAALLLAFAGPWLLVKIAGQLESKTAAVMLALGGVACVVAWLFGLSALAAVTLGQMDPVAQLASWSARSLRADSPVPMAVGAAAGVLLAVSICRLLLVFGRTARALKELHRLRPPSWRSKADSWWVVVKSAEPEAVTIPGRPAMVLITSGMLDALEPHEFPVLLAHERCHLEARHWAFQLSSRLAAAAMPLGRQLASGCDQALERWADEAAVDEVGDRQLVAQTVAKAARATTGYRTLRLSSGMADGIVLARVSALMQPVQRTRRLWLAAAICMVGLALLTAGEAVRDADAILHLAHRALLR